MQSHQTGIFYMGHTQTLLKDFPKELRTNFVKQFDAHFVIIFVVCAIVLGGITLFLSLQPVKETISDKEILKIQERYAQLVLNQPKKVVKEAVEKVEAPVDTRKKDKEEEEDKGEKVDRKKETFVERQQRKEATQEVRKKKREQVMQQVRSAGIFAAITATSGGGGQRLSSASDLLGATDAVGDLSDINISKGTFATKKVDAATLEKRRGTRTTGVDIEKESVGTAAGAQIASAGQVNITTKPAEIKSESGAQVTSKACIQRIINRQSVRVKRVYETWLKRDPNLNGQLKVKFIIQTSGEVTNVVSLSSTTNNDQFDQNILRYIKRWMFDSCSIAEPIEIVFPFAFEGSN